MNLINLIIFIIVVLVVYWLATKIKIEDKGMTETSTPAIEAYNNIGDTYEKVPPRSSLPKLPPAPYDIELITTDEKMQLPNRSELLNLIKKNYVNDTFKFNTPNLPVSTRFPNRRDIDFTNNYEGLIRRELKLWNKELFQGKYVLQFMDVIPVFIMETLDEFVMKANVTVRYARDILYFEVTYYGQIDRTDDPLNRPTVFRFQLTAIRYVSSPGNIPIPVAEYRHSFGPFNIPGADREYAKTRDIVHKNEVNDTYGPFRPMY